MNHDSALRAAPMRGAVWPFLVVGLLLAVVIGMGQRVPRHAVPAPELVGIPDETPALIADASRIARMAANDLFALFVDRGYRLGEAKSGSEPVPRLVVAQLPGDLAALDSSDLRKSVFIKSLLPLLLLENERIDTVAESSQYEGTKPGTILPPKVILEDPAHNTSFLPKDPNTIVLDGSGDGVIDLSGESVRHGASAPRPSQTKPQASSEELKGSLNPHAISTSPSRASERCVVLELVRTEDREKPLPFLFGSSLSLVGITVPPDSPAAAKHFFQPGRKYTYLWGDQKIELVARGVFESIPIAQAAYPGVAPTWYTLSPHEIINLGTTPWTKR
jgi:hypothetical protein